MTQFADDVAEAADELRILHAKIRDIRERWFDVGFQAAVSALENAADPVPGTNFDKATLTHALFAFDQFVAFLNNQAVTQAEYRVNINKAAALKE